MLIIYYPGDGQQWHKRRRIIRNYVLNQDIFPRPEDIEDDLAEDEGEE